MTPPSGRFVRLSLLASVALTGCAPPASPPGPVEMPPSTGPAVAPPSEEKTPPAVVVAMVVDQLAGWIAEERLPQLPREGGFARLVREGTYVVDMRYPQALTATAVGHAALFTGAAPRQSGICANQRLNDEGTEVDGILKDPAVNVVTNDGPNLERKGSSIAVLKVSTVADQLRRAVPDATIVSVSFKDRGAMFGGGRRPTATLWFDWRTKQFVTSTGLAPRLPPWAKAFNAKKRPDELLATPWTLVDRAWTAERAQVEDAAPGEGDFGGLGTTFPHDAAATETPGRAIRATPYADQLVLELAQEAIAVARQDAPLLLAVSLSGNDYVGHVFGPHSWESWENLRRLDAALADFFRVLDNAYGPDGYAVVLSADHGVAPTPESMINPALKSHCRAVPEADRSRCQNGVRFDPKAMFEKLEAVAANLLGPGEWLLDESFPFIYLTKDARNLPGAKRMALDQAIVKTLERYPAIRRAVVAANTPPTCPPYDDDSLDALVCRSIYPGATGDYYLVMEPGAYTDVGYAPGKGANHGTPYLYDRSVPLLVRAPGRVERNVRIEQPYDMRSYARTIADLLGIEPPSAAVGGRSLVADQPRRSR